MTINNDRFNSFVFVVCGVQRDDHYTTPHINRLHPPTTSPHSQNIKSHAIKCDFRVNKRDRRDHMAAAVFSQVSYIT